MLYQAKHECVKSPLGPNTSLDATKGIPKLHEMVRYLTVSFMMPAVLKTAIVAFLLCVSGSFGLTQQLDHSVERQITAARGQDTRAGVYINTRPDCSSGPLPIIRLVKPPTRGRVIVQRARLNAAKYRQCSGLQAPALLVIYRPATDFEGADEFELSISYPEGREHHETVIVGSKKKDAI